MIEIFLAILWLSVGICVYAIFDQRNGNKPPESPGTFIMGVIFWPAFVIAEIYRHLSGRKGGGE